jgi:putative membrane protein insertion efficiency factor
MKTVALFLIKIYQKTISPDHGFGRFIIKNAGCRYYPTCSAYTYDAIFKYGFIKGSLLGFWRILRCHPWSKGGNDPVK